MDRTPVSSSDLKSIGYDKENQILEVEFHGGGIYQYFDVPEDIFEGLTSAPSHGKFFHRAIKNSFRHKKIS